MDYVRLGRTELEVSRLGLGGLTFDTPVWRDWVVKEEMVNTLVRAAIERGINFFDASRLDEEFTGRALKLYAKRREVVVATKLFGRKTGAANDDGLSRMGRLKRVDDSLMRLRMDYVDLCQIDGSDPETPVDEILEDLNEVVRAGKVLHVGASSMDARRLSETLSISRARRSAEFVSIQNVVDFVHAGLPTDLMELCAAQQIAAIPWSPMAREPPAGFRLDDKAASLMKVARDLGAKPAVVGLAWLLSKPCVTAPMIGAAGPHALEDALAALTLKLDPQTLGRLEAPYLPKTTVSD